MSGNWAAKRQRLSIKRLPATNLLLVNFPAAAPVKAPPTFVGHFAGIMLDANVVNYADPEFAGHGPAAAGGMITMQAIEALLADAPPN